MLASTLFINIGNAANQTTYTIQSGGEIEEKTEYTGTLVLQIKNGYYEIINGTTGEIVIGSSENLGDANGTSFSAVTQSAQDILDNGDSLEIAPGNYISDGTVLIKGNTAIFGHGDSTFIQQKANIDTHTSLFMIAHTSNVEISNMWIDGNRYNQFDNGDEMRHGIIPYHAENIWVYNMKITNFTETGYDPAWAHNCTIENSILSGSGDGDVWIDIDSTNQKVRNNVCDKIFVVDFGGSMTDVLISKNFANFVEVYQGGAEVPRNIIVSDNTIVGTSETKFTLYTQGCENITIKGNLITGFSTELCEAGMLISSGRNFTIIDNVVTNCGYGIKSGTLTESYHTISMNDLRGNKIAIRDDVQQTLDFVKYNLGSDISSWSEIP